MKVKLPDDSILQITDGSTPLDVAKSISSGLARDAIVAVVNGQPWDLTRSLPESENPVELKILKFNDTLSRETFWHSSAHVMAYAVKDIFPKVKIAIGPAIDSGFYYDFDTLQPFTPDDLSKIEIRMKELIEQDIPFERKEISREDAYALFKSLNENYKLELLDEIPREETITIYTIGNFVDLCLGPHLPSTGYVKYFKLLSIAGAYWQGDERNPMLQRIYGVSFPKKSKLEEHMKLLHEAEKRDHRKLGKELDLFHFDKDVGPGLVLWTPKGAAIREIIENTWKNEHRKHGYEIIMTPHIGKSNLWKTSGHLDFYIEDMYSPMDVDGQLYFLKPMNCPFHISLYKRKRHSYRDLPLRWTELGTVYRYERSGVLHGLTRVRGFTVDDAHIICRPDQILDEIVGVINFSYSLLRLFGFEKFQIFLSTKPDKYVGSNENWEMAEKSLMSAINSTEFPYSIDEGAGVFYGPKIDIFLTDALQRSWQCTTIQFDFNLPERFDMIYIAKDGLPKRPYVIHRALFGSIERFFAILLEHYSGNFPVWLAPVQVAILPVSEKHVDYAQNVYKELFDEEFRIILDDSDERVGYKIRFAETRKIPYMMILGEKEEEKKIVSIRRHLEGDLGQMSLVNFKSKLRKEINSKK